MADGEIVYAVKVDNSGAITEIKQAGQELGDNLNNKGKEHSSTWKEIWTGAARQIGAEMVNLSTQAASAIGNAVVDITKSAVESYASYEQLVGGVETLFDTSASTVERYAANAFKTAGLSANEYMETVTGFSASLLQSLGGSTVLAAEYANTAVTDMSDNANKMGTSMESIQNAYQGFAKQNYTMLDNLKLGYGGTQSEMKRLIADAEKLDSTFVAAKDQNGEYAMSFSDIVDAIHIVQTDMGITGTTAKEASTTIEGSLNSTKAAWQNLMTGLASGESIKGLIQDLVDNAMNTFNLILPRVKETLEGIVILIEELAKVIIPLLPELVTTLLPEIISALSSIFGAILEILPELCSSLVSNLVTMLEQNLPGMVDAGVELLLGLMEGIGSGTSNIVSTVADLLNVLLSSLIDHLPELLEGGMNMLIAIIEGIVENLPKLAEMAAQLVTKLITTIVQNLPQLIQTGIKLVISLLTGITSYWGNVLQFILSAISGLKDKFLNTDWSTLGSNIVQGIINGLSAGWQWLTKTVQNIVSGLLSTAKRILGINSPSKEFRFIGRMTTEGMEEGLEDDSQDLTRTVTTLYTGVIDDAQSALNKGLYTPEYSFGDIERSISTSLTATASTPDTTINVPLYLDGRQIARATAWYTGEQLAWLEA